MEWQCSHCGKHNWMDRTFCRDCGKPRAINDPVLDRAGRPNAGASGSVGPAWAGPPQMAPQM
eukprot:27021-Alexandrium_andersonii.AAC.1